MENTASIFILPAILALAIKLFLLFVSRNGSGRSSIFFTMVLLFACHNVAEILGFLEYFNGSRYAQVLRWYYVMSICVAVAILVYALDICKEQYRSNVTAYVAVCLAGTVSALILFSDVIISGATSIGYIMTAVKGSQYWLFQILFIGVYLMIFGVLIRGYLTAKDHVTEIQCSYTLIAVMPLVIVVISVVVLMSLGIEINAAGIIPILTTLFLLITIRGEAQHKLTDIRRHIPFSLERKTSAQIMDIFSSYSQDELNYRDAMSEIEKLLVTHKHNKNEGNVSVTAASMDIPRSSLYSIFRRLEINVKEKEKE